MTIKFTKYQTDNSIQLTRDCVIQNWDPKKDSNKPIFCFSAYSDNTLKDIGNVQEKLLWALAGGHDCCTCDDPDNLVTLTEEDLKEAHNRFIKNDKWLFGNIKVKEFRYDEKYGIANITTDKGNVLRIDLLTESEKRTGEDSSKKIFKQRTSTNTSEKLTSKPNKPNGVIAFLEALGGQETRGKKSPYMCINDYGYVGKYQMGEQAMIQMGIYKKKPDKIINGKNYYNNDWKGVFVDNIYGITSLWDYRNSPEKQEQLQIDFKKEEWRLIKDLKLDKYIGKTVNGQKITPSGLLAGSHLVGIGGLKEYLEGNYSKSDKKGTPVSRYIKQFAGYDVSEITN